MWILGLKGFIIIGDTLDQFHSRRVQKTPLRTSTLKGLCQLESMRSEVMQITFNCQNSIVFNA